MAGSKQRPLRVKMTKVNFLKKLPIWFKIENYTVLNDLDDWSLLNQFHVRNFFLKTYNNSDTDLNQMTQTTNKKIWHDIKTGKIINKQMRMSHGSHYLEDKEEMCKIRERAKDSGTVPLVDMLRPFVLSESTDYSVTPLNLFDLHMIDLYRPSLLDKIPFESDKKESLCSNASYDKLINNDYSISLNIDLKNNGDKHILEQIKKLLPNWRKELGVNEPKSSMSFTDVHLKKILKFQIIPYFDLLILQQIENVKIPHRVIVEAIFPDQKDPYTEIEFRQTILKFVNKIMDKNFNFDHYFSK
jgi:hypothetical protein